MPTDKKWASKWPTTLDWNFDFYKLLHADGQHLPLGNFKGKPMPKIAIVGAGIAGIFAARELIKAGCTTIDIYEASERLGGRTYSIKAKRQKTTFEMGAMRIPFFKTNANDAENCILGYLKELYGLETKDFPMPGGDVCWTAAYINDGSGILGNSETPKLLTWKKNFAPTDSSTHPNPFTHKKNMAKLGLGELRRIDKAWENFASVFKDTVRDKYNSLSLKEWKSYWQRIVTYYQAKDFRQLVFEENITTPYRKNPSATNRSGKKLKTLLDKGNFGGLGLTNDQATTFFTIGAGDGGWGAFYDISSLYVIRVLLGGYGADHKLIVGRNVAEVDGKTKPFPYADEKFHDSSGNPLDKPEFLGVQSFAECLFYLGINQVEDITDSIYQQAIDPKSAINFFTNEAVQDITKLTDTQNSNSKGKIKLTSKNYCHTYDAVILTTPTWATQVNLDLKFPKEQLPHYVMQSMKFSHWINSCKVFFPLKERFWDTDEFPQVILTDTFLQDIYIYAAVDNDPGVLLASYTWEDNSMKMLGFRDDKELADICLRKLDEIFAKCAYKKPGTEEPLVISTMVNRDSPVIVHWAKKPTYAGCSKLYRQNNETENYRLLNYNRFNENKKKGKKYHDSNLYFAGEAYSVEGGWIEPAVRLAVDAVIHLIKNNGVLRPEIDYDEYVALTATEYLDGSKKKSVPRNSKLKETK
ncbi:flavin monoamine oxidase family protein [Fibrella forsythiae]|uniref:Tryptophan 2-monooxygenase n=1 Tax=Fibrella forsythiae TaxID=2817061 RepID=A0ABS3JGS0_9BACT|nr:NAD(P)/FAD-dependent oxidoreductase [Fibrella forsythiae]MBO0949206.1 FAD-dependent oxidoreductase [Fibrella forsythiae]